MKRFVVIVAWLFCSIALRASEVTAALTQFHQQLMDLASTLTSHQSGVSIESKIKELEQVLDTAMHDWKTKKRPSREVFREQVHKNFVRVFNDLMDAATVKGELDLTKQQEGQIIALVARFNTEWPCVSRSFFGTCDYSMRYPDLVKDWQSQHKKSVVEGKPALEPLIEAARTIAAGLVTVSEVEKGNLEREQMAAQAEKAARAKEEKEQKATKEQASLPVAAPVIDASEVAKRLSALEKILQDYKADLARALRARISKKEKEELRNRFVQTFVPLHKELLRYINKRPLQKTQEEHLENLYKDFEYEVALELI